MAFSDLAREATQHHVIYMLWVTSKQVQPDAKGGIRSDLLMEEHTVVLYKNMWDEKCCRGQLWGTVGHSLYLSE